MFETANSNTGYASTPTTLVTFHYFSYPHGGLIADAAGDLIGTTERGGTDGGGSVYEVAKIDGARWRRSPWTPGGWLGLDMDRPPEIDSIAHSTSPSLAASRSHAQNPFNKPLD